MKPTPESKKSECAIQEALASARMEGLPVTPETEKNIRRIINGEITVEDRIEEIKKRQKARQLANTINAIEGVPTSEYADELAKRWACGELTGEQMKQLLSEYYHKIATAAKEQDET